jgi:hypothetical protein
MLSPLGCASNVEVVPIRQGAEDNTPGVPEITVERLHGCAADYGDQLAAGGYAFQYKIVINKNGQKLNVASEGIPASAPDFAACTRSVLRDMAIPSSVLNLRPDPRVSSTSGRTKPVGGELASVTVVETVIDLGRLVVRAGGTTILLAISIELAASGVRDIAEALDEHERCKTVKQECIAYCSDTTLPTRDFGWKFQKCKNDCLARHGCPRDS